MLKSGSLVRLEEAQAKARFEAVSARPDLSVLYGYKRTQLANSVTGVNTALAGVQITLPITDRNQGNRAAAIAEANRQQQLLAATQASVLADFYGALQEYQLRRNEVVDTLGPLHQHAAEISKIAEDAYAQGGTDLLRLLDAERARLDAELAYVHGMVGISANIVNLRARKELHHDRTNRQLHCDGFLFAGSFVQQQYQPSCSRESYLGNQE